MSRVKLLMLAVVVPLLAAGPAARPTTRPTSKPTSRPTTKASTQPVGQALSVGSGMFEFNAPAAGWAVTPIDHPNADEVALLADGGRSQILVTLEPKEMQLSRDTDASAAKQMAAAIGKLQQKAGQKAILPPTVEHDGRFDVVIHERLQGDRYVKDEMHLYRSIGPRTVCIVVATTSDDAEVVRRCFEDAKAMLAATKYNRKAFKK